MRKKTNFYPVDELVTVVIKRKSIGSDMLEDVLPRYHKLLGQEDIKQADFVLLDVSRLSV